MQPPGGDPWSTLRCRAERSWPSEAAVARAGLDRLRLSDAAFRHLTRAAAILVLVILGGVIVCAHHRRLPALGRSASAS